MRGSHELKKNYPELMEMFQEALTLRRAIAPESGLVASALNSLAAVENLQGDTAAAERDFREALRIAKKINHREGVAIYTGNLAELMLDRKDWPGAETLARESLEFAEEVRRQDLIGTACCYLAKALARQGKAAGGLPYARRVYFFRNANSGELAV